MFKHTVIIPLTREHADELRDCGEVRVDRVIVDRESACYQDWKARHAPKSRGFGDTIAKITSAVGIKPCGGCRKRQAKLNKMFPYATRAPKTP
jgi:hypothetical protein